MPEGSTGRGRSPCGNRPWRLRQMRHPVQCRPIPPLFAGNRWADDEDSRPLRRALRNPGGDVAATGRRRPALSMAGALRRHVHHRGRRHRPLHLGRQFWPERDDEHADHQPGAAGDVGPSTAFMRSLVDARSGFVNDTDASQVVNFSRAFRLSGSPNGWQVSLTGFYLGFLGIQPLGSLNPKASVEVFGDVDSLDVAASPIRILETVTLDSTGRTSTTSGITA